MTSLLNRVIFLYFVRSSMLQYLSKQAFAVLSRCLLLLSAFLVRRVWCSFSYPSLIESAFLWVEGYLLLFHGLSMNIIGLLGCFPCPFAKVYYSTFTATCVCFPVGSTQFKDVLFTPFYWLTKSLLFMYLMNFYCTPIRALCYCLWEW